MVEDYQNSVFYETFIRRAHKSEKTPRNGADALLMASLINHEKGKARTGNHEKQLEKVKGYIEKALEKFLRLKITEEEARDLQRLKSDLSSAYTSSQLMRIVEKGLEITRRFKDY